MLACLCDDGDAALDPHGGEIIAHVALALGNDLQALMRKGSAQRGRLALQVGVGDVAGMQAGPGSNGLARPVAALRSASGFGHSASASAASQPLLTGARAPPFRSMRVDDRQVAVKSRQDRCDFARVFCARLVIVRPDGKSAANERGPVSLHGRLSAAARCRRHAIGEDARRGLRGLLAFENDDWRSSRGRACRDRRVDGPRPMLRAPSFARKPA